MIANVMTETLQDVMDGQEGDSAKSTIVQEAFDKVRALLAREDRGWTNILGGGDDDEPGMTLDALKEWSEKLRESVVGAPWMGRGLRLRSSYIWRDGIRYGKIPGAAKGRGTNVQALIDDGHNQFNFFSKAARRRREGCLYHDGVAFWIGEQATKKLTAIPLSEITARLVDPNNEGIIWAYQRSWTEHFLDGRKPKERIEWYFVERFIDKRVKEIKIPGDRQTRQVSQTHVIFDQHANSMTGFAFGSPDALAAWIWNGIARDLYMDGVTMSQALATFAFKASVTSKAGGDNTSLKFAEPTGPGSTAAVGGAQDLIPMPSAGKGYDFAGLRAVTAVIAASLDVSNIALTADTSAAGSSYGASQTLDLPTRLAMEARRFEHIDLDIRVLKWMGVRDPEVFFLSLNDPAEVFREAQALLLLWSSGLYKPEPIEKRLSELMQIISNSVPDGVLIPNNKESWERNDIDPKDGPAGSAAAQTSAVGKPNATPAGQGQKSATGKGTNANDIRTEGLSGALAAVDKLDSAERLASIMERMDEFLQRFAA